MRQPHLAPIFHQDQITRPAMERAYLEFLTTQDHDFGNGLVLPYAKSGAMSIATGAFMYLLSENPEAAGKLFTHTLEKKEGMLAKLEDRKVEDETVTSLRTIIARARAASTDGRLSFEKRLEAHIPVVSFEITKVGTLLAGKGDVVVLGSETYPLLFQMDDFAVVALADKYRASQDEKIEHLVGKYRH